TRFQFGGGYTFYSRGRDSYGRLPDLTLTGEGFVPIKDPNEGRGLRFSADGKWPADRAWGLHGKVGGTTGSYVDSATRKRSRANHAEFQIGLFLNLSAL